MQRRLWGLQRQQGPPRKRQPSRLPPFKALSLKSRDFSSVSLQSAIELRENCKLEASQEDRVELAAP